MSKATRTKAFIIEKTAPVFNKQGFAGTSLTDMSLATGLSKGSIYGNFVNKDEVALAVFDFNLNKLNVAIDTALAKQYGAKKKLLVYADNYDRFLDPPFTAGGCPILNTAIEADDTHPALRNKALSAVLAWKKKIIRIIEEGIKNGELSCETNAAQVALTMIAMIEGGVMIAKLFADATPLNNVMQAMKKMILDLN